MARARAVVIGAGIGGLAAAAGLCSAGWDVTACERATSLEPVGAGLALAPNGLRALDVIGAGDPLRALAVPQELGIRRSDGRWLMRSTTGHMIADRFGDPVILVPRAAVIDALTARVPDGVLSLGTEVTSVEPGGNAAARICTAAGDLEADLVVAADGIGSATRSALFPAHPGLRHTGLTTWRLLTKPVTGQVPMAESWGRGTVFGVMPLSDGRVYCYAAASAAPGTRAGDELAELARLFGTWHEPIPALLATARPQDVLRHDVAELAAPLPSLHHGRAVLLGDAAHPMTPNLGQGACQALEDAAVISRLAAGTQPDQVAGLLNAYTAARRPRTTDVVRWSRRAATMTTWTSPPAITARNVLIRLTGKLAPGAALRSLTPIYDWQPPAPAPPAATPGYRLLARRGGDSADAKLTLSARGWYAYRAGRLTSSLLPVTDALRTPDSAPADRGVRRLPVTRAAVRDAALRLFAERGYQLTTMMDIGAALGIRGPSLYKHVASKQELLAEIMTETMTTLIARQQAAVDAGGSPDVQLRRAVEAHVRYHATHKDHALVGNREIGSLDEPTRAQVVELRSTYERGLRAIIERGCAAGAFSTAHPWLVSYAILDMGMGLSSWYHADGEYDVDTLAYAYANLAAQMAGVPTA